MRWGILGLALLAACGFSSTAINPTDAPPPPDIPGEEVVRPQRITGERGVWRFDEGTGAIVKDYAPAPAPYAPMNLTIEDPAAVTWIGGGLRLDSRVTIASDPNPHAAKAVVASGEFTIEIWVSPSDATQGTDPPDGIGADYATIFQASGSINSNNAMIMQVGDAYNARSRTANTMNGDNPLNATPEIQAISGSVTPGAVTQLVLVGSTTLRTLYVNATPFYSNPPGQGTLIWDDSYKLRIGDVINYDRHWRGTVWYMAIYDRALSQEEILNNRNAGFDCTGC